MEMEYSPEENYEEGLDFRQYLSLFWHWAWVIMVVTLIAAAAAYFTSQRMTPFYESSTTVLVNEAPANKASDYSSVMMSEQLASTYAQMMTKTPGVSDTNPDNNQASFLVYTDLPKLIFLPLLQR